MNLKASVDSMLIYRPELIKHYELVSILPKRYQFTFINQLAKKPTIDGEQLISMVSSDFFQRRNPFKEIKFIEAFNSIKKYGTKAEHHFFIEAKNCSNKLDPNKLLERIATRYAPICRSDFENKYGKSSRQIRIDFGIKTKRLGLETWYLFKGCEYKNELDVLSAAENYIGKNWALIQHNLIKK